jgi:hypothetical protein
MDRECVYIKNYYIKMSNEEKEEKNLSVFLFIIKKNLRFHFFFFFIIYPFICQFWDYLRKWSFL